MKADCYIACQHRHILCSEMTHYNSGASIQQEVGSPLRLLWALNYSPSMCPQEIQSATASAIYKCGRGGETSSKVPWRKKWLPRLSWSLASSSFWWQFHPWNRSLKRWKIVQVMKQPRIILQTAGLHHQPPQFHRRLLLEGPPTETIYQIEKLHHTISITVSITFHAVQ